MPTTPTTPEERFRVAMVKLEAAISAMQPPDPRDKTLITRLAALLDGVLADDPQAIRDAAAWLAANRPEVDGGDGADEGER